MYHNAHWQFTQAPESAILLTTVLSVSSWNKLVRCTLCILFGFYCYVGWNSNLVQLNGMAVKKHKGPLPFFSGYRQGLPNCAKSMTHGLTIAFSVAQSHCLWLFHIILLDDRETCMESTWHSRTNKPDEKSSVLNMTPHATWVLQNVLLLWCFHVCSNSRQVDQLNKEMEKMSIKLFNLQTRLYSESP